MGRKIKGKGCKFKKQSTQTAAQGAKESGNNNITIY